MDEYLKNILLYNSEGPTLDFKKEKYKLGKHPKKNDLLKDFIAFTNHPSQEDKYIFVGVKEKNGIASEFFHIENPLDEANYQEFIKENIEPNINFEYKNFEHEGRQLGYFRLFNNNERPYLFRKNVQKPNTNHIEYKVGDGYIKVGTSTKKITRTDFELIYKNRFKQTDRKNELKIIPIVGIPDERYFYNLGYRYIDIEIENTSNKSITFDIELTVFKSDGHLLFTEEEVREKNEKRISSSSLPKLFFSFLSCKETEDSLVFEDTRATQFRLAQHDTIKNIFSQQILLRVKRMNSIEGQITLRSDDFIDGPLKSSVVFEIPNIEIP